MFEYEKIEPVFPGSHVKDWQKIRKKQWKFIKNIIKEYPSTALHTMINDIKKEYYLLESPDLNAPYSEWAFSEISAQYHPHQWQGGYGCSSCFVPIRVKRLGEIYGSAA